MKTLKSEEVYRQEYRDLADARASIGRFIDQVYNRTRLHSALGNQTPAEFERTSLFAGAVIAQRGVPVCVFGGMAESIGPIGLGWADKGFAFAEPNVGRRG